MQAVYGATAQQHSCSIAASLVGDSFIRRAILRPRQSFAGAPFELTYQGHAGRPRRSCRARAALGEPVGTSALQEAPSASPHSQHQQQPGGFDWVRQWYPLAIAADLDPKRVHSVQLLGQPLALWHDGSDWRAFEDRCPHRLAPLTGADVSVRQRAFQDCCPWRRAPLAEGRVEDDGTILCSYHGWRFNGDGKCTSIPQAADDPTAEEAARASSRSCVKSFPVQIRGGLLWVWGEPGAAAFIDSAAREPAHTRELEELPPDTHVYRVGKLFTRDLKYDFATLVENFLDPAHVPFAHHGVIGNRYKETSGFIKVRPSAQEDQPADGFCFDTDLKTFGPNITTTRIEFEAPSHVRYFTKRPDGTFGCMDLHCVPSGPGRARVTYSFLSTSANKFTKMGEKMPVWMDHQQRHLVFDGDHRLLHIQEQIAAREAAQGSPWKRAYYMPAQADKIVTAWRSWLDKNGPPTHVPGAAAPPAAEVLPKEALLNRWEQHTKDCPHCLKALSWFKALRAAAAVASLAAATASLALALTRSAIGPASLAQRILPAGLLVAAAVAAFAWRKASGMVGRFYYKDYDHQAMQ